LAATLSPSYGIYSGFELCENRAVRQGSEEYLDSEKYQVQVWDWDRPGNIKDVIARVNHIRREHRALAFSRNLRFLESSNPNIIAYAKFAPEGRDILVIVVNLDPHNVQEGMIRLASDIVHPMDRFEPDAPRLSLPATYGVRDLLADARHEWHVEWNYVCLDPRELPAHILSVEL
jgi:starch synthase (maltosyl-transferring)